MEFTRSLWPMLRLPLRSKAPVIRPVIRISSKASSVRFNSTETPDQTPPPPPTATAASSTTASSTAAPGIGSTAAAAAPRRSPLANLITGLKEPRTSPSFSPSSSSSLSNDKNAPLNEHPMEEQPWHLHVLSHKHNTHLTLTRPNRKAVISISTGNIGFRKAQRGSYDAAYQLGAYLMARINRAGLLNEINDLEVVFRGFGNGREALGKILLGSEGSTLRPRVKRVSDGTRLKFGGTRSPRPRRV